MVSLRDYSEPLLGNQRFVPVRSDDMRLLTCLLEYEATSALVRPVATARAAAAGGSVVETFYKPVRRRSSYCLNCV